MAGEMKRTIGGHLTLSGGTRTIVKTVRPWQPKLVFPATKEDCPFCSKSQEDEFTPGMGWKTFKNSNTPWPYHRLLIPTTCWEEEGLRSLGGRATLDVALRLAFNEVLRTRPANWAPIWIYTHIGYGAGQNFPHHHWHINEPVTTPRPLNVEGEEELWQTDDFRVVVCGVRAGQTLIIPKKRRIFSSEVISQLSREAWRVVHLFNEKFDSPDYCLFLGINDAVDEWYIRYTPVLNNWGGSEIAALDHGTPFVLPWPHAATVAYLKGES